MEAPGPGARLRQLKLPRVTAGKTGSLYTRDRIEAGRAPELVSRPGRGQARVGRELHQGEGSRFGALTVSK